jgi:hypothetical protein
VKETVQETHAREKACDFVEACLAANLTFEHMINFVKWAWIYVHDERAYQARQVAQRTIQQ